MIWKPAAAGDAEAATVRLALDKIKAKEYASVAEAAFLLNCSDSHVRNLVDKASVANRLARFPLLIWTACVCSRSKSYLNGHASRNLK